MKNLINFLVEKKYKETGDYLDEDIDNLMSRLYNDNLMVELNGEKYKLSIEGKGYNVYLKLDKYNE